MIPDFFLNPVNMMIIAILIFGSAYFLKRKSSGASQKFEKFEPIPTEKTVDKELSEKFRYHGRKFKKGKLVTGFHKIANVSKYLFAVGKFSNLIYDPRTKMYSVDKTNPTTDYRLLFIATRPKGFINWLLQRKAFYIIDPYEQDKKVVTIDHTKKTINLPDNLDIKRYFNVWCISNSALEYLNVISQETMLMRVTSALENYPEKIQHLEMETIKKIGLQREMTAIEKSKWEERKESKDSTIL